MNKIYNYKVVDNSIGVIYQTTNRKSLKKLLNIYYNNNYIIEYKSSYNIIIKNKYNKGD